MQLKCLSIISDFASAFKKGEVYEATELKNGFCEVVGDRKKRDGTNWCGIWSLGHVMVLGVAKFSIIPVEEEYGPEQDQ